MADDDQSIDDQAETATGGLTNDMPGLPMSPPSGPRPPSALGGLASAFQRMMGGAPPPRSVPQGQSPWQAPGRSQMPVQPGQVPPEQRWKGTTASLFLPKGAPQPPAKYTPWMRGPPTTSYAQWGQDSDYNQIPQPFEGPALYQNAAKFFGQNGSASIIPLALSMGKNAGAFVNGVMQGQQYAAKMRREKMLDDATELDIKQQQEMYVYKDTVDEYASAKGVGSAGEIGSYAIKGRTVLDALGQEAMKLGDDKFLAVLGTGSVEKAMAFLHQRNDNWQTLKATNKSAQKQNDADNDKEWGVPPDASGGGSGNPADNYRPQPRTPQPTQPSEVPKGGPAPTPVSGLGGALAKTGDPSSQDPASGLQPYQQAGLDNYREGKSLNDVAKGRPREHASVVSRQLGSEVDNVKAQKDAGKLTGDQIPAALNKIIPGMGDDYNRVYSGAPMPTGALGRSPYWQALGTLAAPDPLVQAATLKDFAPGGKDAMRLAAGARMGPAAKTVLEALKKIPEGEPIPYYMADALIAGKWTGDPKYLGLFNALNTYIQEAQSLNTQTGRFYVTEVESIKKHLQSTTGPRAIRTILQQDAENSTQLIDQIRDNYHRGSRRQDDPPTYDDHRTSLLRAISSLNPDTGFRDIPEDKLPEELRGLGLGDTGQGGPTTKIPSGWTVTPVQ
jgi:hypothetical protein